MAKSHRIPSSGEPNFHTHGPAFKYKAEFSRLTRQIPEEEKRALVQAMPEAERRAGLKAMGITHNPKQVALSMQVERLFTFSRRSPMRFAGFLLSAMFEDTKEVLDEKQYEEPNWEDFGRAAEHVAAKWSEAAFGAWLYAIASLGFHASEHAERYLLEHPIESLGVATEEQLADDQVRADDPLAGSPTEQSPVEADPNLYTPMTQQVIRLLVRTAAEEDSAPKPDEVEALLNELLASNSQKLHHWFLCGFGSGLGLVDAGFALDSAALNESRRAWQLSGYLLALSRRTPVTDELIKSAVLERSADLKQIFRESFALEVCRPLLPHIAAIDALLIEEMLAKIEVSRPEQAVSFLELLEAIDSESVKLLRRSQPSEASVILHGAQDRLSKMMNLLRADQQDRSLRRAYLKARDLQVRLAIGISACDRLRKNFSEACSQLASVSAEDLKAASNRTTARYHLQYALARSSTRELLDVRLPRTLEDSELFIGKYREVVDDLQQAAAVTPLVGENLYNTKYDALYLLAGLAIANGEWEPARMRIDEVCSRFDARQERRHLVPELRLHQILVDIEQGGPKTTQSAIERLISDLDDAVRMRTEEVDRVLRACLKDAAVLLPELLAWLGSPEQTRHEPPSVELIEELALQYPKHVLSLLPSARRAKPNTSRFDALKFLLDIALDRQETSEVEAVLTDLETTISDGSSRLTRAWAEFLRDNAAYRELFGRLAADLESAAYFQKLDDLKAARDVLVAALERQLPVESVVAESRAKLLIEELRGLDASLADAFAEDSRCVAPTPYVPFIPQTAEEREAFTPVRVLFVGGMREEQGRHEDQLRKKLEAKYGESLVVKFEYPGWGSNWMGKIEQVGRDLDEYEALVMMPLVRTTFGRRLRRLVDDKSRPWIPCPGNGTGSSLLALSEAYRVVLEQRERR